MASGYTIETSRIANLLELIPSYTCPICLNLLKDPIKLIPCGVHIFCGACISVIIDRLPTEGGVPAEAFPCPMCRQMTEHNGVRPADKNFTNIMDLFEIKCKYESNGCDGKLKIAALLAHEDSCKYRDGMNSRCSECKQWVEGSQWLHHRCVTIIGKNLNTWRKEYEAIIRKQRCEITKLHKELDDMSNKFKNINDRFENFHIRIGVVEKAIVAGVKRRFNVESSDDEEYAPANLLEMDFSKKCEFCDGIFLRAQLYKHQKSCQRRKLNRKNKLKPHNLMDEFTSGTSISQLHTESSSDVPLIIDLEEDSSRTVEDQATNPPFTQGYPNGSIEVITLSGEDN